MLPVANHSCEFSSILQHAVELTGAASLPPKRSTQPFFIRRTTMKVEAYAAVRGDQIQMLSDRKDEVSTYAETYNRLKRADSPRVMLRSFMFDFHNVRPK
jgi:hypothetical protein